MGSNYVQRGEAFQVPKTNVSPTAFNVGDPVRVGNSLPAVAMTGSSGSGSNTTVWTYGAYNLSVDAPSATFSPGDVIYFQPTATNDSHLTNDSAAVNNVRWGYVLQVSGASGSAYTVLVKVGY